MMTSVLAPGAPWPQPYVPPVQPTRSAFTEKVVLEAVQKPEWARLDEIGVAVGMSRQAVGRVLARLAAQGLVESTQFRVHGHLVLFYRAVK